MLKLFKYSPDRRAEWNSFVEESVNGTFLFKREYIEYHRDRYQDESLMFYLKNKLVGLIPGNRHENIFYSHSGLTYGGLVYQKGLKYSEVALIYDELVYFLGCNGIEKMEIRLIPSIYSSYPSEEQLYLFFNRGFMLKTRTLSSVVDLTQDIDYSKTRKRGIRKARVLGGSFVEDQHWGDYWDLLTENLVKNHNTKPVHSLAEIIELKNEFPRNIKLTTLVHDSKLMAGVVLYVTSRVVHSQYAAVSFDGRNNGSLDYLYDHLICKYKQDYTYFDFGHSNELDGTAINLNLIYQKEGFGARGIVYDTYSYEIV